MDARNVARQEKRMAVDGLLVSLEHNIKALRNVLANPSDYRGGTQYTYALAAHMDLTALLRAMVEADKS